MIILRKINDKIILDAPRLYEECTIYVPEIENDLVECNLYNGIKILNKDDLERIATKLMSSNIAFIVSGYLYDTCIYKDYIKNGACCSINESEYFVKQTKLEDLRIYELMELT